jgi:hypothetical protein
MTFYRLDSEFIHSLVSKLGSVELLTDKKQNHKCQVPVDILFFFFFKKYGFISKDT